MMKQAMRLTVLASAFALLAVPHAQAQMLQWQDRVFVNINGLSQSRADITVTTKSTQTIYDETATFDGAQTIKTKDASFDIGGGVRVWKNFGVGVSYTTISTTGNGAASASVPHPLIYDRPRTATAAVTGLKHEEGQVHLSFLWMLPLTDKLDVAVFGGPTFFQLTQGVIGAPTFTEVGPPYTSITMSVAQAEVSANKTGANVGADVTFKFMKNLGVGGFIRWAGAKVSVTPPGGTAFSVNVGGFQFGGGARVRF